GSNPRRHRERRVFLGRPGGCGHLRATAGRFSRGGYAVLYACAVIRSPRLRLRGTSVREATIPVPLSGRSVSERGLIMSRQNEDETSRPAQNKKQTSSRKFVTGVVLWVAEERMVAGANFQA